MAVMSIQSDQAPKAIGPYSQATVVPVSEGEWIYVSGQLPIEIDSGQILGGDITTQTGLIFDYIVAILDAHHTTLHDIVRVDVFLKDIKRDFLDMNAEYARRFTTANPPARQTIQVADLPMGSPIEISCIAFKRS